eukprot:246225_1
MVFRQEDFQQPSEQKEYVRITCIVGVVVLWCVYLPLTMYYGYKFFLNRNFQVLKKRYSYIACIEIILVIISFIFTGMVILADYFLNVYLRNIAYYTSILVQYCILYCWVWRFWLLFFDVKWLNESLNVEWKRLINPKIGKVNFFIDRRHDWGNKRWVLKRILIIVFIASAIVIGLRYKFDFAEIEDREWYGEIPYLIFFFTPFITLGIILWKIPNFDDNIFIVREMKAVTFVLFFIIFSWFMQEMVESTHENDENINIAVDAIFYIVIETCNFICILITTAYVMNKVKLLLNEQQQSIYLGNSVQNPQTALTDEMAEYIQLNDDLIELQVDKNKDDENEISLFQVLSHAKAFDLLVNHVAKEFSIECLLSYVEFIQFKQYMYNHLKLNYSIEEIKQKSLQLFEAIHDRKGSFSKTEIDVNIYNPNDINSLSFERIKFPSNVPRSHLIYEDDINFETNNFKDRSKYKIYKLYCKYVKVGCELEINVSHRTRNALSSMIDHLDIWMNDNKYQDLDSIFLMHIFDKSIVQMIDLLKSSFSRFRQSNQFAKLSKLVFVDA